MAGAVGHLAGEVASGVVVMSVEVTLLGAAATVAGTEVEVEGTRPIKIWKGHTRRWSKILNAAWQRDSSDFVEDSGFLSFSSTVD